MGGSANGAGTPPPAPQQQGPGFLGWGRENAGSLYQLASLMGGMTHNKNPALTQLGALGAKMQSEKSTANKTVEWLKSHNDPRIQQLAGLVEQNPSMAQSAVKTAHEILTAKPAESFTQAPGDPYGVTGQVNVSSTGKVTPVASGGTNVSVTNKLPAAFPDADKGYQYKRNPDGTLFIDDQGRAVQVETPGGKAEAGRLEAEEKAKRLAGQQSAAATTVVEDLDRMDAMVGELFDAETPLGQVIAGVATGMAQEVPRSRTNQMGKFKESVLSNVGIDQLMQMKFNSPTGGALGQVPFQQQQRLEQLLGSLDLNQDPAVIRDNIARIKQHYLSVIHGTQAERDALLLSGEVTEAQYDQVQKLFDESTPSFREGGIPTVSTQAEYDALPPGTRYRDPNGAEGIKGQ